MCGNERIFGRFAGDLFVFGNLTNIMKRLYIYVNLCYNKIELINMDFCHRQFCDGKGGYYVQFRRKVPKNAGSRIEKTNRQIKRSKK